MRHHLAQSVLIASGLACGAIAAPNLLVSDVNSLAHWTGAGAINGVRAFSFGLQFCNEGDAPASWRANTNQHAISAHNVYRLLNGRLEQIGVSWVAHEFFALQMGNICGFCPGGDGTMLQPGCATVTTSNYTGIQANMGARSQVNPSTVAFAFPFQAQSGDSVFRRVQIAESDLADPSALYFVEAIALHPDDAAADGASSANNASYRRIAFAPTFAVTYQGATAPESAGVFAWRDHGLGAGVPDPDVLITTVDVPASGVAGAGGRFYVAAKATNIGFGRWRYEYAIENLNCDRAAATLTVTMPESVAATVTNIGFHDVNYHSGEVYDNADWTPIPATNGVGWRSPEPFAINPNSNALRWGTLYNFRFEAEGPPIAHDVTLGLFRPGAAGDPNAVSAATIAPATPCAGDANNDRVVNFGDLNLVLGAFGQTGTPGAVAGDPNGDGVVNFADLNLTLSNFGSGC